MEKRYGNILAVVLNWNNFNVTENCIRSLYQQEHVNLDVLLVDNNSLDFSKKKIINIFKELYVIQLKENKGVAGGRNEGFLFAIKKNYKYILFFDNDATAHPRMVIELLNIFKKNENCGIAGPKILRDDKKNIIWRAGCLSWRLTYLYSYFSIIKRIYMLKNKPVPLKFDVSRGDRHKDKRQFEDEIDIDFQIGCAQMIKQEVVNSIGILDDRFSPYGSEDIDFCERAKKAGWRIRYAPKAICWHKISSQPNINSARIYYNLKNIILLARKHLTRKNMLLYFLPDFVFIHLPLILIDNTIKKPDCSRAVISAIKWHFKDIKLNGLFINN
jgi:GT2 family glycosyltransferase